MVEVRFEGMRAAAYDGGSLVGTCDFSADGPVWTVYHTEVDAAYGGQGIARRLVKCVAAQAARAGVRIKPLCSFVAREFAMRPEEYADVRL